MNKIFFIWLLLPNLFLPQNVRIIYEYKFVTDTLKKDAISEELVVLDIEKDKKSLFTGLKHIISDSTMTARSEKGIMSFPDSSMKIKYVVEKDKDGIFFYTANHMPNPVLKVKDERRINWRILPDKQKIGGYSAQKATTNFGGREWVAWFTPEIPFQDGPYKFYGLPGLILKVSDKTNSHSFEIVSVEKKKSNYDILNDITYKEAREISFNEYEKISKESDLERFRKKAFTGDIIFKSNEEKQNFLKDLDAKIKESKIHDNNPIEFSTINLNK
ncbi:GLPGLI family protein [Chryseobacterium indologenes]|uniref:GLPGLI family protein n=1 Tax=Chryseobacterium TaxID=59732 RepID=UPI00047F7C5B|nr:MULTISPECIES: GLPGLI family protein [Chryseobacterium]TLX23432.1 GLPGLI family protein [Chryseobacterium indologenes]